MEEENTRIEGIHDKRTLDEIQIIIGKNGYLLLETPISEEQMRTDFRTSVEGFMKIRE